MHTFWLVRRFTRRAWARRLDHAHETRGGDRVPLRDGTPDYVNAIMQREWR